MHPALAEIWLDLINAVRWKVHLDGRLREIVIIRVGYLNRCSYVVKQHVPLLCAAGRSDAGRMRRLADWRGQQRISAPASAPCSLSPTHRRATWMCPMPSSMSLRRHFNERQIVELTVLVGTYNMHTRMCQALKIDPQPT